MTDIKNRVPSVRAVNLLDHILLMQIFTSLVNLYGFFHHAIPDEGVLTLEELHHIVRDIWLTRFDDELESERSARRKGRPKSTKEMKLEELKLREAETYRTGMGAYPNSFRKLNWV